jgi:hypothetical protein
MLYSLEKKVTVVASLSCIQIFERILIDFSLSLIYYFPSKSAHYNIKLDFKSENNTILINKIDLELML